MGPKAQDLLRCCVSEAKQNIQQVDSACKAGIQYNESMKNYYVYILASKRNGTLYTGVTNNLSRRTYEHKESLIDGFTKKYNVKILVYYEQTNDIRNAIAREKCIKRWKRAWKIKLIEETNPQWEDLSLEL